ncbi:hypothetical protein L0U85_16175 [Glycomyces sp. L485]|uniref:hypothetical protein n=1 Tax=Glycomyces sp. L485 TaxID=2909235 RepID=UPI001F4AC372|nr:hypothetical protein [Glycomyces sp. L485]MCH7232377.1 hypothetical protein [Glycomyces sp. L485]
MSPDTTAKRPDSVTAKPSAESAAGPYTADGPQRPGRMWTYLTYGAATAFVGAIALAATSLFANVAEVSDTPERSVEAFLGALLDDHDPDAARGWLCEEKADRDLAGAADRLAEANDGTGLDWSNVTETGRSVGGATVTAELATGRSEATTWTFTLVAEDSDPQWLVCDMARG